MNDEQAAAAILRLEVLRRRHAVAIATRTALGERERELTAARRRLLSEQEELQRAQPRQVQASSLDALRERKQNLRASLGYGPNAARAIAEQVPNHTIRLAAIALSLGIIDRALTDLREELGRLDTDGIGEQFHTAARFLRSEAGLWLGHHLAEQGALVE